MKIVIPGGSGQIGQVLARQYRGAGHTVVILGRGEGVTPHPEGAGSPGGSLAWDGKTLGPWAAELDGADVVINLAGRTVNCRYTEENLEQMMSSRVDSTRVVGEAIAAAKQPPRVWLQMSTATIYAHRLDAPNDEATGVIGGNEPDVPAYWKRSIDIAVAWERTQAEASTPNTRKVALRTAMMMSPDRDGIFDVFFGLVRKRLGGAIGGGAQYVSWIHDRDFLGAIELLIARDDLTGPVNLAAPNPLPQREFMATIREAAGIGVGLPATAWMARLGAWAMRTDAELALKSRRVVPGRLLEAGYKFAFPTWKQAVTDLVARWRAAR